MHSTGKHRARATIWFIHSLSLAPLVAATGNITSASNPDVFQSCKPATFKWQGDSAPYSVFFATRLGNLTYGIEFRNIPDTSLTFIPNFPPGSNVTFFSANSLLPILGNLMVQDSDDTSCAVFVEALPETAPINDKPLFLESNQNNVAQCSNTTITFQGGGSPPWALSALQAPQEGGITFGFLLGGLSTRNFTTKLPFPAGTTYSFSLNGGSINSSTTVPFQIADGTDATCLVLPLSSPSHSPPLGTIIGGSIGGVALLILIIAAIAFVIRKRKRKNNQPRELFPKEDEAHDAQTVEPFVQLNPTPFTIPHQSTVTKPSSQEGGQGDDRAVSTRLNEPSSPIYHQDAGRAEFPPAYHDIREDNEAIRPM